jgi:deoxyribodipyrimidine photo-lyase
LRRTGVVATRLRGVGSPYAVEPGSVTKDDGSPYAVFTPFYKRWSPLLTPLDESDPVHSLLAPPGQVATESMPSRPSLNVDLPTPTEAAAHERWEWFCDNALTGY